MKQLTIIQKNINNPQGEHSKYKIMRSMNLRCSWVEALSLRFLYFEILTFISNFCISMLGTFHDVHSGTFYISVFLSKGARKMSEELFALLRKLFVDKANGELEQNWSS